MALPIHRWSKPLQMRVSGPRALFTMIGTRAEPYTLPLPPPTAAIGLLSSVYWKPEIVYCINRIEILKPIRRSTIMLNGLRDKPTSATQTNYYTTGQRHLTILRDVDYVFDFSIRIRDDRPVENNLEAYVEQVMRRIEKRTCFRDPCLGLRKFMASFGPVDETTPRPINLTQHIGMIPHSRIYDTKSPTGRLIDAPVLRDYHFDAKIDRGVMIVPEFGIAA